MSRQVVTVGPMTSAKYAAEVMARHGYAALPVVDDGGGLVGIVAEADVLRHRVPSDPRLRSVPVLEDDRLVGIVSRRDVLRALVRPDEELQDELQAPVESYTGEPGAYDVQVRDGMATVRRVTGVPQPSAAVEAEAVAEIARTVGGIVSSRVSSDPGATVTGRGTR